MEQQKQDTKQEVIENFLKGYTIDPSITRLFETAFSVVRTEQAVFLNVMIANKARLFLENFAVVLHDDFPATTMQKFHGEYQFYWPKASPQKLNLQEGTTNQVICVEFVLDSDFTFQSATVQSGLCEIKKNYTYEQVDKILCENDRTHDLFDLLMVTRELYTFNTDGKSRNIFTSPAIVANIHLYTNLALTQFLQHHHYPVFRRRKYQCNTCFTAPLRKTQDFMNQVNLVRLLEGKSAIFK